MSGAGNGVKSWHFQHVLAEESRLGVPKEARGVCLALREQQRHVAVHVQPPLAQLGVGGGDDPGAGLATS